MAASSLVMAENIRPGRVFPIGGVAVYVGVTISSYARRGRAHKQMPGLPSSSQPSNYPRVHRKEPEKHQDGGLI